MSCSCSSKVSGTGEALRCQKQIAALKQQINKRLLQLINLVGARTGSASCHPNGCAVSFQGQTRRGPAQLVARLKREVLDLLQKLKGIVGVNFADIECTRTRCGEFVFNDRI